MYVLSYPLMYNCLCHWHAVLIVIKHRRHLFPTLDVSSCDELPVFGLLHLQKQELGTGTQHTSVAISPPVTAPGPSASTVAAGIAMQELKAGYDAEVADLRSQLAAEKKQAENQLTSQKAQLKALVRVWREITRKDYMILHATGLIVKKAVVAVFSENTWPCQLAILSVRREAPLCFVFSGLV